MDTIFKIKENNSLYNVKIVSIDGNVETGFTITTEVINKIDSQVNNPNHYGGKENTYEAIKVIEAWELNFHLGNVVKYISRAGKKDKTKLKEDLEKAKWYLDRFIGTL